jgi:hypothetical protein
VPVPEIVGIELNVGEYGLGSWILVVLGRCLVEEPEELAAVTATVMNRDKSES